MDDPDRDRLVELFRTTQTRSTGTPPKASAKRPPATS
jgi:hypothetical protein